jgi:uncharacterized linocin/CFP29 family protein
VSDHLRREQAPVTTAAWAQIDQEAARTLRHYLVGRAVADVDGPLGWDYAAAATGRTEAVIGAERGVVGAVREVIPTEELRAPFTLAFDEIDAADRGCEIDLEPLVAAARAYAAAEDRIVFYGDERTGMDGIVSASPHESVTISEDYEEYPGHVARAVATLKRAGIGGPYALCLGPRCYTGVIETTEHGGYPLLEHLRLMVGGPVLWAPAVDGAVVVSRRGGDYELVLGQDVAIGYRTHTLDDVELYLEGSLTFRVRDERAAVALRYSSGGLDWPAPPRSPLG